jgi:hypothetical protein
MICVRAMYQSVEYARGLHSGTLVVEVSAQLARFERFVKHRKRNFLAPLYRMPTASPFTELAPTVAAAASSNITLHFPQRTFRALRSLSALAIRTSPLPQVKTPSARLSGRGSSRTR